MSLSTSSSATSSSLAAGSASSSGVAAHQKFAATSLLKSLETGDSKAFSAVNAKKYIQHNLAVEDGVSGVGKLIASLPKGTRVSPVRAFADGEFVFVHVDYDFFGPKVGFDIFRFESGLIVEHWDNLAEIAPPNPSGHSQLDGSRDLTDLDKTAANKALVEQFITEVFVKKQFIKLAEYIASDNFTQHNSRFRDNLSGFNSSLAALATEQISLVYSTVHKVLGEGNFVLVVSEGEFAGKPTAFYDLFRVESGKIVEHWDVIETIPPAENWKNENGKFKF